ITGIDLVETYFDYPGERPPLETVARALDGIHANRDRLAADMDGYQPHWGYRGPRLTSLLGAVPKDGEMLVESLRRVKSAAEIARPATSWSAARPSRSTAT